MILDEVMHKISRKGQCALSNPSRGGLALECLHVLPGHVRPAGAFSVFVSIAVFSNTFRRALFGKRPVAAIAKMRDNRYAMAVPV